MGSTGVGKTDLAIAIFDELSIDIISVDSVQIYKYLNIGSGKLSTELLRKYPHKLVDKLELEENYSAGLFRKDAIKEIENSIDSGNTPLLVGGTMMYFRSLFKGLANMPSANNSIRISLTKEAEKKGWPFLHKRLETLDPKSAEKIHPNDSQRIQRALEVYELSTEPMSSLQKNKKNNHNHLSDQYNFVQFAIKPQSRDAHRKEIQYRFDQMLNQGLIIEVENLLSQKDINSSFKSLRSVGYKEVCQYLEGFLSYDEMVFRAVTSTRQLAKRQMTWLKSWENVIWVSQDIEKSVAVVKEEILKAK